MMRAIVLAFAAATFLQADSLTQSDAHALVREVVAKELAARKQPANYRYQRRFEDPKGVRISDRVGTREGFAERLVSVDGHAPTAEQHAANARLLDRLAKDVKLRQSRLKDQQEEEERIQRLIEALPDAFHFQFEGTDSDHSFLRLSCKPDPSFHPHSRETMVYQGMEGHLSIDRESHRLARFEATLVNDVDLGWGFLARVSPGGRFLWEQSRLADGNWLMTAFQAEFDGKILLVKNLRVREKQALSSFERLPDNVSLAGAIRLLLTPNVIAAGSEPAQKP